MEEISESEIPKSIGNYNLKTKIGQGSFATVWKAENIYAKKDVAIKIVDNSSLENEESKNRFIREISIIKQMDHPFICKLFEIINTPKFTYLVMEYAESGSILTFINKIGRLPEPQARRYFSQLLSGIEYLHNEKQVAHRDLKAENVLLDRNMNIRLIDFGLSNVFSFEKPELRSSCGSPAYASPEMVRGMPYTKMADIWSAGVLLYAIVTGQLPFEDDNLSTLLQKIAFTEPEYPSFLSPQLVDLLKKILTKSSDQRLSIHKIKAHPWFSQTEYAKFLKLRFWTNEKWLAKGIDRDIVDEISSFGLNTQKLPNDLICSEYNEVTAIYLILRREQITNQIDEMMQSLKNSGNNSSPKDNSSNEQNSPEKAGILSKSNPSTPKNENPQHISFKSRKCDLTPVLPNRKSVQIKPNKLDFSPPKNQTLRKQRNSTDTFDIPRSKEKISSTRVRSKIPVLRRRKSSNSSNMDSQVSLD